jgi:hypothetical protein
MHIIQPPLFDFEQFIVMEKGERLIVALERLLSTRDVGSLDSRVAAPMSVSGCIGASATGK